VTEDASAYDVEVIRTAPLNAETPEHGLRPALTSSRHVYIRSNFDIPRLGDDHAIEVRGLVEHPFTITPDELRAMPQRTLITTMECAGNDRLDMRPLPAGEPWRHGALSTMAWSGVSLGTLLARARVAPGALEVEIGGADAGPRDDSEGTVRFARSIPIDEAQRPDTLLAVAMNEAPLAPEHGAPARLVVPGWYGMTNVKWVSYIDVRATPFTGYFQRQRYVYEYPAHGSHPLGTVDPVTRMRVKSAITSPADGSSVGRELLVEGWAWSGTAPVTRVELAVDGGETWRDTELGEPSSPYAWTPWRCTVSLPRGGRYTLRSRATDAAGAMQPAMVRWNRLGYGNNAVRGIVIDAR
jgi:DMSO/TMAO reductase YedYZ molybdopterin-dependent catalytic subunit